MTRWVLHAHSPVEPSPFSRVPTVYRASPPRKLRFISAGNSDDPFDSTAMDTPAERRALLVTLTEEDWAKPLEDLGKGEEVENEMTLEEDFGISMEVDPSPLKARNTPISLRNAKPPMAQESAYDIHDTQGKGRSRETRDYDDSQDDSKVKDASQAKVPVKPTTRTRTVVAARLNKENTITRQLKLNPQTSPTKPSSLAEARETTNSKTMMKPPPPRARPQPEVTSAAASSAARSATTATPTATGAGTRCIVALPSKWLACFNVLLLSFLLSIPIASPLFSMLISRCYNHVTLLGFSFNTPLFQSEF